MTPRKTVPGRRTNLTLKKPKPRRAALPRASETEGPVFVLVGPFARARALAAWANLYFRKDDAVCFVGVDAGLKPLFDSALPITIGIGDWDSLKDRSLLDEAPTLTLKRDKNQSDLAVAIDFALSFRARAIIAAGFQGGRLDQEWANALELARASKSAKKVTSFGPQGEMHFVSSGRGLNLETRSGQILSVFPVGGPARGVRVRGLRFAPRNGILSLSSEGLSNRATGSQVSVTVKSGTLMILLPASD